MISAPTEHELHRAEPSDNRSQACNPKILVITAVDAMVSGLLLPWLEELQQRGMEVHVACSRTNHFERLQNARLRVHDVNISRSFNLLMHIRAIVQLCRLMRSEHFDLVNTHSPIGAAVGRVAAALCSINRVIYTVHGFYFHDRMPWLERYAYTAIEWLLGRVTCGFMFVSDEDRQTAQRLGITRQGTLAVTIYNGVDIEVYCPRASDEDELPDIGNPAHCLVIGTVGRIVKEKGLREFLDMAMELTKEGLQAKYLVVGDSLPSDRDQFGPVFRTLVADAGLAERFIITGMTDRVPEYLRLMDIFVLASYREGFPRSILEAMATSLPVVATNIRGCRESVVHKVTGLIVSPADAGALTAAVRELATRPKVRMEMGCRGRELVVQRFDFRVVKKRFGDFVETLIATLA